MLALDTSSRAASCAVWKDGAVLAEFYCNAGLTHSQTIMPMTQAMLQSAKITLREIDRFAVSSGPGSFTGLRIGLSAVKAMALALDKPCAGVSALHCLAANVRFFSGVIAPVMDARRGQVYTALFEGGADNLQRLCDDDAISVRELKARLSELPGAKLLAGDGAQLCKSEMEDLDGIETAPPHLLHQRASCIAEIAADMDEAQLVCAGDLVPSYLRLPQAERELQNKL
ncbi:MAG: tRNA (adenosine(37)-N6)-threonylcarbamoyltransferase complex dimerization subunit type 1 TsaB [Oscillospiraceae bacterium]|nr:tRNA (adenosine(37)-N6)-threonylcarbamoyltransferase complex dimerization subunit type 1 TsaB [Oscillospiraceae bacterium]